MDLTEGEDTTAGGGRTGEERIGGSGGGLGEEGLGGEGGRGQRQSQSECRAQPGHEPGDEPGKGDFHPGLVHVY